MSISQKSSPLPKGRAVLLSIKPRFAELILSGSKCVEFRRSWAKQNVDTIVLYSSAPVQKIVGIVEVKKIVVASPTSLWKMSTEKGGGLTRDELRTYFAGKLKGVAVLLGKVSIPMQQIDPSSVIKNFVPPQSFRYLEDSEYLKFEIKITAQKRQR